MFASYVKPMFKKIRTIIPETAASTAVGSVSFLDSTTYNQNFNITLYCTTGSILFSPLTTAPTVSNAFLLAEGEKIELTAPNYISLVSASTLITPSYQAIIWE